MPCKTPVIPAEFRQHHRAAMCVVFETIGAEIYMPTLHIAHLLVVPAACVIDEARCIECANAFRRLRSIELSPPLVERHPQHNAGAIVEMLNHLRQFEIVFFSPGNIVSGKIPIVIVFLMPSRHQRCGNHHGAIRAAAVGHVLPDKHAEPVAVIVPAQRLELDVLSQHIEAHALHRLDVGNHGLVRGRGEHPIRPIPLIEYA